LIDSTFVFGLVAQVLFWVLLVRGVASRALGTQGAAVFVGLWVAGYVILPRIAWWTGGFVLPWIAILDIALVFIVFEGDVRLR